jgi:uncharacterized protein YheU (UPF0270 family)
MTADERERDDETSEDDQRRGDDRGEAREVPVEVPVEALSPAALAGVVDAFVLREGTDYGMTEVSHEAKAAQVRRQLERGEAKIVFDSATGSVTLLTLADWKRLTRGGA